MTNIKKYTCRICLYHNEKIETNIIIYNWSYSYMWIKVFKVKVPVSNKWKNIQYKNIGTWWRLFNKVSWDIFMKIPIFWWVFVMIFVVLIWFFGIPLWLFLDIILRKKIYWEGLIKLRSNWTLYLD